jgi:hypothetical protein
VSGGFRGISRVLALAALTAAVGATAARAETAKPLLALREGATTPADAARIAAANAWWQKGHPGETPCRKCVMRPPGSDLLWTYYRRQGFFPNWVSAARDLLRRHRAGEVAGFRRGVEEIVSYSVERVSPQGIRYRINESPYLAPDSTPPPWRDAMGQGLVLTLFIPAIPANPSAAQVANGLEHATAYLNSFAVHWRDGGVAADGSAGGRWYLEYATEKGERARVLNGFMQSLVSLDRFAKQAERFGADPRWGALRDRAREYVRLGALELDAHLDEYDLGGGISKYSLTREGPAPDVYQTYHRQLLRLLQDVEYLPKPWREHFSDVRVAWGGRGDGTPVVTWLGVLLAGLLLTLFVAVIRRRRVVRRAEASGAAAS